MAGASTQASRVIAADRCSERESLMVTRALAPLNTSAFPNFPAVVQRAPVMTPAFPCPEESATLVPEPSLKEYAATSPKTGGGGGAACTVIVTVALDVSAVSLAVSWSKYVPGALIEAVVRGLEGSAKTVLPGPVTWVHATVKVLRGRPSSVAFPFRLARAGNTIVWSPPALTSGG